MRPYQGPIVFVCALISCKTVHTRSTTLDEVSASTQSSTYEMTIEGPFKDLIYNRHEDIFDIEDFGFKASPQKAKLTFNGQAIDATIRLRGGVSFCGSFPHLKLKLPKASAIDGMREFKIITHGTYPLDPAVPVSAPNCGDSLYTEDHLRELHEGEVQIYELASKLLKTHLKNLRFMLNYRDLANNIDLREKAYFIESADDATKRYSLKRAEFPLELRMHAFRARSDEDFISVLQSLTADAVRKEYERLGSLSPKLSEEDIGRQIKAIMEKNFANEDLQKQAIAQQEDFFQTLKKGQIDILRSFDPESLSDTLLFETMLVHTDWNIFGVTDHDDPLKNVEVFKDEQGKLFVAPYDFDSTAWTLDSDVVSEEIYQQSFDRLRESLKPEFEGIIEAAIQKHGPEYLERAEKLQRSGLLNPQHQHKMDLFIPALRAFLKEISK